MSLSILHKEFIVAFYKKLLEKNNYILVSSFLNFDKSLSKLRKELFKKQIFIEVLSSKVFSRAFFELGGAQVLFCFNSIEQLKLIPDVYLQNARIIINNNTVYAFSHLNKLIKANFKIINVMQQNLFFGNTLSFISNTQILIIQNTIKFCLKYAHN